MLSYALALVMLAVVDVALLYALFAWWQIARKVTGREKVSARFFVACFTLYVIGQTSVLLWMLRVITLAFDVSVYLYAIAAILFAIGSFYKLSTIK